MRSESLIPLHPYAVKQKTKSKTNVTSLYQIKPEIPRTNVLCFYIRNSITFSMAANIYFVAGYFMYSFMQAHQTQAHKCKHK